MKNAPQFCEPSCERRDARGDSARTMRACSPEPRSRPRPTRRPWRRDGSRVEVSLRPFALHDPARTAARCCAPAAPGSPTATVHDQFIQFTEGVIAHEERSPAQRARYADPDAAGDRGVCAWLSRSTAAAHAHVRIELVAPRPRRLTPRGRRRAAAARVGLGPPRRRAPRRAGRAPPPRFDQARPRRPARRRPPLHRPRLPAGDAGRRRHPAGRLRAGALDAVQPRLRRLVPHRRQRDAVRPLGRATRVSTRAQAGPLQLDFFCGPTPAARAARPLPRDRVSGAAARVGLRVLEEPRRARAPGRRDRRLRRLPAQPDRAGRDRHRLALGDPVQHLGVQPPPVPRRPGMVRRMRADGVRTVVWCTPWVNLDSRDGQIPPQPDSERLHREPAPNYAPAAAAGYFVRAAGGRRAVRASGGWAPARWSTSPARRPSAGGGSRPSGCSSSASRESRPTTATATTSPTTSGWPTAAAARRRPGRSAACIAIACSGRSTRSTPATGSCSAAAAGPASTPSGCTWGGDQASDFWSLRVLVVAALSAACSGISNFSHDIGGYLGHRLVERCPPELLVRWLQFGCFSPLMHAHSRMPQEPWNYGDRVLGLYRAYVLLHEQLVPYVRAAARTAARTGLPIIRPLCLIDPRDPRGWTIDRRLRLRARAVGRAGARRRHPRARGVAAVRRVDRDLVGPAGVAAAARWSSPAPIERIPVWVRAGAIIVTYPAEHVAAGWATRPSAIARWWPRCGGHRPTGGPAPGWPTAAGSPGATESGSCPRAATCRRSPTSSEAPAVGAAGATRCLSSPPCTSPSSLRWNSGCSVA